jgi:glycosyltransferase involved in cell wall biosynthesis
VVADRIRRVSIVIPVFNNEPTLHSLYSGILNEVEKFGDIEFELVFVNDGSSDASLQSLLDLSRGPRKSVSIKVIDLEGNFGQLGALFAGYKSLTGDAIISMSADLQDPPLVISEFVDKWIAGHDLVIGVRAERTDSLSWRASSRVAYWFISSRNNRIPKGGFDYYLMSKGILDYILGMNGRFRFLPTDLMRLNPKTAFVDYHRQSREVGKSGYSLLSRWQVFLTAMVDTSYRWIQFFSLIGLAFASSGVFLISSVVYGYLTKESPFEGFTLIVCLILISSGIQMILLSLIGEYVWRSYDMQRNKPLYLIRSTHFFSSDQVL